MQKKRVVIITFTLCRVTYTIVLSQFLMVKPYDVAKYARAIPFWTTAVTS